jgi:ribosome biogenesis ATPase
MQGLWQKRKVNLNAAPTVPSTNAITSTSTTPPGAPTSTPSDEPPRTEPAPAASGNLEEVPSTTAAASSKRKLRSTREEGGKRTRVGAKEHTPPTVRLSDLGGVNPCVEKMLELVAMPLMHPEVYLHTGVQPPRGVLLHGPPGCGKTMLANAIGGVRALLFLRVGAGRGLKEGVVLGIGRAIYFGFGSVDRVWDVWRVGKDAARNLRGDQSAYGLALVDNRDS